MSASESAPAPPKVDPETLAIRARPRRAIRFRRGVIIGISAAASVSLAAVTWMALKPMVFRQLVEEQELSQPARPSTEAVNGLPASYGDVPRLGPPLPGDLGRPIVERQRRIAAGANVPEPVDIAAQEAAAERERELAGRRAARESGLLVSRAQAAAGSAPAATVGGAAVPLVAPGLDADEDSGAEPRKPKLASTPDVPGYTNPHRLAPAPSPWVLTAGSVIPASLITGVRSDLAGLVTAQVTERVYDSPTGRTLLIPQGARLIGSYENIVAFGQKRALIVWQRLVMPDGSSLAIDYVPATDASGRAGLEDRVDMHGWQLIRGIAISTLLGIGSELAFTGDGDLVQALRRSTQDNVSRAGDQITLRNLNVQPTITIRPGAPVRLVVHKDLVLAPWKEAR